MPHDDKTLGLTTGMAATPLCHHRSPVQVRATAAPWGWLHVTLRYRNQEKRIEKVQQLPAEVCRMA